jgi:hypothetical protein
MKKYILLAYCIFLLNSASCQTLDFLGLPNVYFGMDLDSLPNKIYSRREPCGKGANLDSLNNITGCKDFCNFFEIRNFRLNMEGFKCDTVEFYFRYNRLNSVLIYLFDTVTIENCQKYLRKFFREKKYRKCWDYESCYTYLNKKIIIDFHIYHKYNYSLLQVGSRK